MGESKLFVPDYSLSPCLIVYLYIALKVHRVGSCCREPVPGEPELECVF